MAVHDTVENKKTECTKRTLDSLLDTVDFTAHRLFIIDNGSCEATHKVYSDFLERFDDKYLLANEPTIIYNKENVGTAAAINQAWQLRYAGEHCIKMDNDVVIHYKGWIEEMEAAIKREPKIGIVGLKRKDCWEQPKHDNADYKSELIMLPHEGGEAWIIVEKAKHIIGTCQMYSDALLNRIGFLYQPGLYGYDDVLASWRSQVAGFINVFLPHIPIDHIDKGETVYQSWKEKHAGIHTAEVIQIVDGYIHGTKDIYYAG